MSWSKRWTGYTAVLVILALGCVCQVQTTMEGEEGNVRFMYSPADGDFDEDRPLGVGSTLQMEIDPLGDRSLDEVTAVSSSDSSIIEVELDDGRQDGINLHGRSAGHADIEVQLRGGGENYSDWIRMEAADVDEIEFSHVCSSGPDAVYLADYEVEIKLDRRTAGGTAVVGSSYNRGPGHDYPGCYLEIDPIEEEERPYCNEKMLTFPDMLDYGEVILFPVDGVSIPRRAHPDLGIHAVDASNIYFDSRPTDEVRVDRSDSVRLEAFWEGGDGYGPGDELGELPVCTNMEMDVVVHTPEVCTGGTGTGANDLNFTVDPGDENTLSLRGESRGICQLDVYVQDERGEVGPFHIDVDVVDR